MDLLLLLSLFTIVVVITEIRPLFAVPLALWKQNTNVSLRGEVLSMVNLNT